MISNIIVVCMGEGMLHNADGWGKPVTVIDGWDNPGEVLQIKVHHDPKNSTEFLFNIGDILVNDAPWFVATGVVA